MEKRISAGGVARYAGGFLAWMIGSGFASGQEVLQFFSSFGLRSYLGILLNGALTMVFGVIFVEVGFRHRQEPRFNHFLYYCGQTVGRIYSVLITVIVFLLISVLTSGAGATLEEYYGMNHFVGSALTAAVALTAYLIGFEKLVSVVSKVSPVVIAFALTVGLATVLRDGGSLSAIPAAETVLYPLQTSPSWVLSALLYLSLNFFSGGAYFTQLGHSAENRREVRWGMLVGIVLLVLAIVILDTAFLLNAEGVAERAIPILYLARRISPLLGTVFSVVLVLGIFCSSSSMMWTVCSRVPFRSRRQECLFAVLVAAAAFLVGLMPFGQLISVFFPLIGYIGLLLLVLVLRRVLRDRRGAK